jgi:hypothetical protein
VGRLVPAENRGLDYGANRRGAELRAGRLFASSRHSGFATLVALLIGLSSAPGCGSKTLPDEAQAAPAYASIARQLQETTIETDVQQIGSEWTKARLVPKKVAAQLTQRLSKSEPFRLLLNIDYRVDLLSRGAKSREAARKAAYDSSVKVTVIAELGWQENRWYLNKLMLGDGFKFLNTPPVRPVLAKAIVRIL